MNFTLLLLISALVIFACILFNKISNKIGIPVLLAFIVLGMLFGSDGIFKIPFENYEFSEKICTAALIFIIFYGGFGTNWKTAKPVAVKSIFLSSLGVIVTAGLTGLFCYFILKFDFLESMLIGAVLGSTDAASVFSVLRSKKLNLKYNTASMLEVESGSNDPWAYMLTIILISIIKGTNTSAGSMMYMLFAQLFFGAVFGVLIALAAVFVFKHFKFISDGFDAIFVVAIAVLSYALPSLLGGNGYLSAYIVGIVLGNTIQNNKKSLVHFFDGITGLMQILIFFLLGLLSTPSKLPDNIIPATLIAVFLTVIARPAAVALILTPFKAKFNQQCLVAFCGLRGATSIVFAIMAAVSGAYMKNDLFHIVFCVVLISISIQGTLLPYAAKRLNMIDNNGSVMKTFTDYVEDNQIQFIKLSIDNKNPWVDKKIKDISLPPETLIAMIVRNGKNIVPNGNTVIEISDNIIITAPTFNDGNHISLSEINIDRSHKWCNKKLTSVVLPENTLILMIRRNGRTIIPNGNVKIRPNDVLVINSKIQN